MDSKNQHILNIITTIFILFFSLVYIQPSYAATITVTTTEDELNSDGDCSLREAIQSANANSAMDNCTPGSGTDTIMLSAGTFTLTSEGNEEDNNATGDLDITESVTIAGAGMTQTIIDGNGIANTSRDRVLEISIDGTFRIEDLTIQNGWMTSGFLEGAGIRYAPITDSNSLTLERVRIQNNVNDYGYGAGIASGMGSVLLIRDSVIQNNVYESGGTEVLPSYGGAIYSYEAEITIENTLIRGNKAVDYGGGIASNVDQTLTISRSGIIDNSVTDEVNGRGGGIMISSLYESYSIQNTTFADNRAAYGGGLLIESSFNETSLLNYNTFKNNYATEQGAGIYKEGGELNSPGPSIRNTISIDNFSIDASNGSIEIEDNCTNVGSSLNTDSTYNLMARDTRDEANAYDAEFCPLPANNITLTETQNGGVQTLALNDASIETFAIISSSEALDAADPASCLATDQRGITRPFDGNFDSDPRCDIGAYEYFTTVTPTATPTRTPTPTVALGSPTPTLTPTANSQVASSSNNSSTHNVSTPQCSNTAPSAAPDLFQIDRKGTEATLYFTPAGSPVTYYYISYGLDTNAEGYGVQYDNPPSEGVISYTVRNLDQTKQYYFKVRAGNGCMPGPWSGHKSGVIVPYGMPNTGRHTVQSRL